MNRNRNLMIALVVAFALALGGWWLWAANEAEEGVPTSSDAPAETVDEAEPGEQEAFDIAGTWQSAEDARFVREFDADGTVIDRYDDDESATVRGSWNYVEDPSAEQAELPDMDGMDVIKIQFAEEVMYFAIAELTDTSLSMIYLFSNSTLDFVRI